MRRMIFLGGVILLLSASKAQQCTIPSNNKKTLSKGIVFKFTPRTIKFKEALSQAAREFPELNGLSIEVRRKHIGTMMAARPKPGFIFRKPEHRKYVIFITDKPGMNAEKIYSHMSYCAQLGVLGHELCHILDYRNKSNLQMLGFAIAYPFNKKSIEAKTDLTAVQRGFGEELIEYTRYIHHSPLVNRKYLVKKKKYYLSASELAKNIHALL
jgi:hypothetical protein